jgi:hypothetical protein
VHYPSAVYDDDTTQWISDAEVAETVYTAFETSSHKVTTRLVVRRVKERNLPPQGQQELFPTGRYHALPDRRLPDQPSPRQDPRRNDPLQIINIPARIAHHARHIILHLPERRGCRAPCRG